MARSCQYLSVSAARLASDDRIFLDSPCYRPHLLCLFIGYFRTQLNTFVIHSTIRCDRNVPLLDISYSGTCAGDMDLNRNYVKWWNWHFFRFVLPKLAFPKMRRKPIHKSPIIRLEKSHIHRIFRVTSVAWKSACDRLFVRWGNQKKQRAELRVVYLWLLAGNFRHIVHMYHANYVAIDIQPPPKRKRSNIVCPLVLYFLLYLSLSHRGDRGWNKVIEHLTQTDRHRHRSAIQRNSKTKDIRRW